MPKPPKVAATTIAPVREAQPKWPAIKPKKGLTLESILEDQIYIIDVSSPFSPSLVDISARIADQASDSDILLVISHVVLR